METDSRQPHTFSVDTGPRTHPGHGHARAHDHRPFRPSVAARERHSIGPSVGGATARADTFDQHARARGQSAKRGGGGGDGAWGENGCAVAAEPVDEYDALQLIGEAIAEARVGLLCDGRQRGRGAGTRRAEARHRRLEMRRGSGTGWEGGGQGRAGKERCLDAHFAARHGRVCLGSMHGSAECRKQGNSARG
eukprot:365703-Chlamydomonas_euryale.AAC.11